MKEQQTQVTTEPTTAQKELTELLAYIKQQTVAGVEGSKALVSEQAPLVAREIVAYKQAQAVCTGIPLLILIGSLVYFAKKAWGGPVDNEGWVAVFWLTLVLTCVGVMVINPVFIKPFFAPRLVILDYIQHLL